MVILNSYRQHSGGESPPAANPLSARPWLPNRGLFYFAPTHAVTCRPLKAFSHPRMSLENRNQICGPPLFESRFVSQYLRPDQREAGLRLGLEVFFCFSFHRKVLF